MRPRRRTGRSVAASGTSVVTYASRVTLRIRPETPADAPAIREVLLRAFDGPAEADLVEALRRDPAFEPALSLVAEEARRVVGHILFTPVAVEGSTRPVRMLALAPMAVDRDASGRWIGSRLVREGLVIASGLGYDAVVVLGHPRYYPRFGFEPARPRGITSRYDVPDEVYRVLELRPGALDGVTGTVIYPPAFDAV